MKFKSYRGIGCGESDNGYKMKTIMDIEKVVMDIEKNIMTMKKIIMNTDIEKIKI